MAGPSAQDSLWTQEALSPVQVSVLTCKPAGYEHLLLTAAVPTKAGSTHRPELPPFTPTQ